MEQQEQAAAASPAEGQVKRKRSRTERAVTWTLISVMLIVVAIEAHARLGHDRTLNRLRDDLVATEKTGKDIKLAELPQKISGFAFRTDHRTRQTGIISYRWPSLFKTYVVKVNIGLNEMIASADSGFDEDLNANAGGLSAAWDGAKKGGLPGQGRTGNDDGFAKPAPGTIAVTTSDVMGPAISVSNVHEAVKYTRGMLARELIRQSFILSAQEACQQNVRDQSLGEDFRSEAPPLDVPYRVMGMTLPSGELKIEIRRGMPGLAPHPKPYLRTVGPIKLDAERFYESLLEQVELLSRTTFPDVLKESGVIGQPNAFHKKASIPAELTARLSRMDEMSQLTAVRELHALMRKEGESPERLAGLVRAYANLGSLTENHWQWHHKAFKARALLYAQRLIALDEKSAWATAHRGYAWALTGRLGTALADFETAGVKQPEAGKAAAFPRWILDAQSYCAYEPARFPSATGDDWPLAAYLAVLCSDPKEARKQFAQNARYCLKASPGCARAVLFQGELKDLGNMRELAEGGLQESWPDFYRTLQSVPGLPAEAVTLIKKHASSKQTRSDEPRDRSRLIRLLKSDVTGGPGAGLSIYGTLLGEISFLHAEHRIRAMHNTLGLPADSLVKEVAPTIEGHPYANYLLSKVSKPQEARATFQALVASLKQADVDLNMHAVISDAYRQADPGTYERLWRRAVDHSDLIQRDVLEDIESNWQKSRKAKLFENLNAVAPNLPQAVAGRISEDGPKDVAEAKQLETRYDQSPTVLQALADWFTQEGKYDDALRCIERRIKIAPEHKSYRALADFYLAKNDRVKWKATLEAMLTRPAEGLGNAFIESELAYYHMHRNELSLALPFAKGGAESYSGWGLKGLSFCYERLGRLKESEQFAEALSERYDNSSFEWYFWCVRMGQGNLAAARRRAQHMLASQENTAASEKLDLAIYYLVEKDLAKAEEILKKAQPYTRDAYTWMHSALLADIRGDAKERDRALQYIKDCWRENWTSSEFAELILAFLATPDAAHWNKDSFWRLLGKCSDGDTTNYYYFAGRFFELHGQPELGLEYLKLAASSPERHKYNCMLASMELRNRGVAIPAIRPFEAGAELADLGPVKDDLQAWWKAGQHEKIVETITQSLAKHPDWSFLLVDRATAYEWLGKPREAIADYELALERNPNQPYYHRMLALIRAACEDPALRDPVAALKHAQLAEEPTGDKSHLYYTCLAVAYAANGDFDKAVEWQKKAVQAWPDASREDGEERLKLFQEKKPFIRPKRDS